MSALCGGVWVPAATPFQADGQINRSLFVEHCRCLIDEGADGLAVLGTTSEANSLSVSERQDLLSLLIESGASPEQLMPGTGSCSITDAVQLTKAAVTAGCVGVLVLPPFYYKALDDDALFAYFSELIERVGDKGLRVYLYHIPPIAQVGFSLFLIERLLKRYGSVIAGLKDSSGDFKNTRAVIEAFPSLRVFPGSESFLLDGLRAGAAGCISATGNINLREIKRAYLGWNSATADSLQAGITHRRKIVESFPLIPAIKAVLARRYGDATWRNTRVPLMPLDEARENRLIEALAVGGYTISPELGGVTQ
ncbi:dihydrodipicolinate synthetase family protein [Burkholderia cenocepacia]|uniref:Dihydrodipicolinate synthetase family protein n=1 Tax=Burkholderia cenocepacia TaxID=95486 RepID=A0AAN0VQY4_9BURK|nr:dihydrodipicolinate synthetase family protein [Burkholderia cenocepacia]